MADILTSNLYPPIIDSFMPAFVINEDNPNCIVKFQLSDMNTLSQINENAIQVILKNQKNNVNSLNKNGGNTGAPAGVMFKTIKESDEDGIYYIEINPENDLIDREFYQDELYKLQIRFTSSDLTISDETIPDAAWINENLDRFSEWSTVCLLKRISNPSIKLSSFRQEEEVLYYDSPFLKLNEDLSFSSTKENEYLSHYWVELYSCPEYNAQDDNIILIEKSDVIYNSEETFLNKIKYNFKYALASNRSELERNYKLKIYIVTNNLYSETFEYDFIASAVNGLEIETNFQIAPDPDQGRIGVTFSITGPNGVTFNTIPTYSGQSLNYASIFRTSNKSKFIVLENKEVAEWEEIGKIKMYDIDFAINSQTDRISTVTFYDNTIESGVFYQYGLLLTDENETVNSIFAENLKDVVIGTIEFQDNETGETSSTPQIVQKPVFDSCDFDNIFINSQLKQLKLQYDSRINSYKRTVTETKIETLGSRYPFVRRNSATNYKQFNLGGLISFHTDDNNIFLTEKEIYGGMDDFVELYNEYNLTHNINPYNDYVKEREFREKVLDFLSAGEIMLLRTPTEGNVLVRLMDLNITPNQSLNNHICNFTATAIEIDEASFENYYKYNIYEKVLNEANVYRSSSSENMEHSSHIE